MNVIHQGVSFDGYQVERMLGRGGMGVVYEAVQVSLGRRVALKVLRPELADDPEYADRLRREGKLQASIEHPNVLDVYEVGQTPNGLFLAMRLVDGPPLSDLIRGGGLDADRALGLLDQVAGALDAAHAAGLVHRDVKPQNVLVGDGDHAYLADFGLSRQGGSETLTKQALGTVAYLSPELVRGEAPTAASDVYAFAAMAFHCLTGDVPFPRGSDAAVLYSHANDDRPRASEHRPDLPAALDPVFASALAIDPAERPAGAGAIVADIRDALGADAAALGAPGPSRGGGGSRPDRGAAARSGSRRLPIGILAVTALAAAALGIGAASLNGDGESSEVPLPPVPEGAVALGSALGTSTASLGCRGEEDGVGGETSCAIVQSELPDAQLLIPEDGMIVGWTVRGAGGEVALDVIRPRGESTVRVSRSQWESVGNDGPHHFETSLPAEGGDVLGIELAPGATVGVAEVEGAETQRWFEPFGGAYGSPDRGPGTGFDHEVLLRADFVPGGEPEVPERLSGAAAANAPKGKVRERDEVTISKPAATVEVELVEVGDEVALDLLRDGRRIERVVVPDLVPEGQPIDMQTYTYEGEPMSEVDIWWVNPSSGRAIFHFFNVSERHIQFIG